MLFDALPGADASQLLPLRCLSAVVIVAQSMSYKDALIKCTRYVVTEVKKLATTKVSRWSSSKLKGVDVGVLACSHASYAV